MVGSDGTKSATEQNALRSCKMLPHVLTSSVSCVCRIRRQRAGRSAISLQHILHKRKRYDPKVAKQAQFYASAKQHKSYQRLLKREGYTTPAAQPQTYAHDDDEESDGEAERQQPAKRRREEERAVDEQAADAVEAEATADKRGDSPSHVNDDEGNEGEEREAGWTGPAVKRKKKAAGPVRKSDEQIRAEIAERAQKLRESRHVRAEKFKKHAQRTSKGQPVSHTDTQ